MTNKLPRSIHVGINMMVVIFIAMQLSCTNLIPLGDISFKVQSFDLFSQLVSPQFNESDSDIYSNWILRRERLSIIDYELAKSKPSIIFFQHLMKKNDTDSDEMILSSNSLARYDFTNFQTDSLSWTEYISTVTSSKFEPQTSELYTLDRNSFISSKIVNYQKDPILLLNVQQPLINKDKFFSLLEKIYKGLENQKLCKHRVIIAGYFGDNLAKDFSDKMEDFYLKNPFANLQKDKVFSYKDNPLYRLVIKSPKPDDYNYDFIFVPKSSSVAGTHLVYNKTYPNKLKRSKLKELSPSIRSGLEVSVSLKSCN